MTAPIASRRPATASLWTLAALLFVFPLARLAAATTGPVEFSVESGSFSQSFALELSCPPPRSR